MGKGKGVGEGEEGKGEGLFCPHHFKNPGYATAPEYQSVLKKLQWLPIRARVNYKTQFVSLTYKMLSHIALAYLINLVMSSPIQYALYPTKILLSPK